MIFVCLFITAVGLSTGVVGFTSVKKVGGLYNPIATVSIPFVENLGDLRGEFRELRLQVRSIAFIGNSQEQVNGYIEKTLPHIKEVDQLFAEYEKLDPKAVDRKSYKDLRASWDDFKKFGGDLLDKAKDFEHNKETIVHMIREICPGKADVFYSALEIETKLKLDGVHEGVDVATAAEDQAINLTMIFSVIAVIASVVTSYWFSSRLSKGIVKIANRLNDANSTVKDSVDNMTNAGNNLSHTSNLTASTLEEIVASLEEITSMVKLNSENARQAAQISTLSRESAETGEREIKTLIQSMQDISQSSRKIEDIITVIDDIAFQTNLLALNAAVEAARAGEQGKGFAVVADAVRALAQRSASAAKDISELIKDSVTKVDRGSAIADQSGTVLQNIVTSVKKVSDLNNEIATGSSEQTTGIQQISQAMNQLDQTAQSNAASAREISSNNNEINEMADIALSVTEELREMVLGKKETAKDSPSGISTERQFDVARAA
jgi:methyl-accepting chemotaxis protein